MSPQESGVSQKWKPNPHGRQERSEVEGEQGKGRAGEGEDGKWTGGGL